MCNLILNLIYESYIKNFRLFFGALVCRHFSCFSINFFGRASIFEHIFAGAVRAFCLDFTNKNTKQIKNKEVNKKNLGRYI